MSLVYIEVIIFDIKIRDVSVTFRTVIVVIASMKEDKWGGQSHTSASHCVSLPCDTVLWTHIIFTRVCFQLCVLLSATDGEIEQYICITFCVNLGKSATGPWNSSWLLENILLAGQLFLNDIHVSGRWWTFRVTRRQQNNRKCLKNSRNRPWICFT